LEGQEETGTGCREKIGPSVTIIEHQINTVVPKSSKGRIKTFTDGSKLDLDTMQVVK
jgi:hypothetical protein